MSRSAASFVLGYHGCDRDFGMRALAGEDSLRAQERPYHWLGSGIYFWENDPHRAYEWATEKAARGELEVPFVIGAIIDLGDCLDLQARENVELVARAYRGLKRLTDKAGGKMPVNRTAPKDPRPDKVLRFLDCAVINHLLTQQSFDTVRGMFVEGGPDLSGR